MAENRLEQALSNLKRTEQRLKELFPGNVVDSRAFKQERLKQLDHTLARFQNVQLSKEESFFKRLIQQERIRLNTEIYPNAFLRLGLAIIKLIAASGRWIGKSFDTKANDVALSGLLSKHGFGAVLPKINANIGAREQTFSIPYVKQVSEKERLDYKLNFDTLSNGSVYFKSYTAALYNAIKSKPESILKVEIDGNSITREQAAELLTGRAIKTGVNNWSFLDANDKDSEGNNRIKEVVVDFDLADELSKLKIKELKGPDERLALQNCLENGMRVPVTIREEGRDQVYYIQADPLRKGVSVFESQFARDKVDPVQRPGSSFRQGAIKAKSKRTILNGGELNKTKPRFKR